MRMLCLLSLSALIGASISHGAIAQPGASASQASVTAAAPKSSRAENRALAKRVLKALARTRGLDSTGLFVKAVDGNVTLTGAVPDASQIPLAVETTQRVDGVTSVRQSIRLQDRPY
jgi:hyperosmotically inducible periplasmic protein